MIGYPSRGRSLTCELEGPVHGHSYSAYLFGTRWKPVYNLFYVMTIIAGALVSIRVVVNFIDGMYAVMAIPTMIATLILAPRVMAEARRYFAALAGNSPG